MQPQVPLESSQADSEIIRIQLVCILDACGDHSLGKLAAHHQCGREIHRLQFSFSTFAAAAPAAITITTFAPGPSTPLPCIRITSTSSWLIGSLLALLRAICFRGSTQLLELLQAATRLRSGPTYE